MNPKQSLFVPGLAEVNASPPLPPTGCSHPRCYARALKDCSQTISREHYVSKQVMELWAIDGKVSSNMLGSIATDLREVHTMDLVSKVLCTRHNRALAPLDEIGGLFVRFIKGDPSLGKDTVLNGYDLERWLLKIFLGLNVVYSKQHEDVRNWQPRIDLLRALFYKQPLDSSCGLYGLEGPVGPKEVFALRHLTDKRTREGVGVLVSIQGFVVMFAASQPESLSPLPSYRSHFHPSILTISKDFEPQSLHTGWSKGIHIFGVRIANDR